MTRYIILALIAAVLLTACGVKGNPVVPTVTLAADWKRFESKGVSLALPDTFFGGNPSDKEQQPIAEGLKEQQSEFYRIAEYSKKNPDLYLLYFIDTQPAEGAILTDVNVGREKVLPAFDPGAYALAARTQLPSSFKAVSQEERMLQGQSSTRLIIEATTSEIDLKEVVYIVKHGDYMYTVIYTTDKETFEDKLPMFEQSFQTFTVTP